MYRIKSTQLNSLSNGNNINNDEELIVNFQILTLI